MKAIELKEMSLDEISRKELDLTQELFNLRFQHGTGQLENTSKLQSVKREIARVKTIIRQKEIQP
ncbi:MAG: 50S ribosomal protein L29 [Desulfobacterales bacterium]|jgi:large subunit ribosomal protein L29|nr:50S ribosomal protein L29 [Desulfobacterales bacterium]